mmetsp:Transcript_31977/g.58735  ORF Transcript_31977/g.58735 Transcript_31977/m.58735 type:complete len:271 (+) Transcript_31977:386-1198(+)
MPARMPEPRADDDQTDEPRQHGQHDQGGYQHAPEQHDQRLRQAELEAGQAGRDRVGVAVQQQGHRDDTDREDQAGKDGGDRQIGDDEAQVFSAQQLGQRPGEIGHAVEADREHDQGGPAPEHLKDQQHEAEDRDLPDMGQPGAEGVLDAGRLTTLQAQADLVEPQAQQRPEQQKAGTQRQRVDRRVAEHHQHRQAHQRETATEEAADGGRAAQVGPTEPEPVQRCRDRQALQRGTELDGGLADVGDVAGGIFRCGGHGAAHPGSTGWRRW